MGGGYCFFVEIKGFLENLGVLLKFRFIPPPLFNIGFFVFFGRFTKNLFIYMIGIIIPSQTYINPLRLSQ